MAGTKNDNGKPKISLIDLDCIMGVIKIFEHGNTKYEPNNWLRLEPVRLYDAMFRHFVAFGKGEWLDKDSGMPHILHIAANAFILFTLTKIKKKFNANEEIPYEEQTVDNGQNCEIIKEWV